MPVGLGRPGRKVSNVLADTRLKIAVFIDFDNIEIGVKSTLGVMFDVGVVLEALKERGDVVSKIAYGDWTRAGDYSRSLTQHATKLVQRNLTPGGDKNGADINLALDALEMAFTHSHINAYVIVGGDSDFITLVEKLKQYDKQIFVVGGRAFTSLVMQRNCHEFIAYENLVGSRRSQDRGRQSGPSAAAAQTASLEQAVPLVRRALKVLSDREVSPQLGLLKSTLLQLDSTFSERTYGAGSFRDFAQKLASAGHVTLKEAGRNVLVELTEGVGARAEDTGSRPAGRDGQDDGPVAASPPSGPAASQGAAAPAAAPQAPAAEPRVADGIREVRRLFQSAQNPPRWPMYIRQAKQFLRNVDASFDERKFGFASLVDLMRACQRDGLFRIERDRQGVMRIFPGNVMQSVAEPVNLRCVDNYKRRFGDEQVTNQCWEAAYFQMHMLADAMRRMGSDSVSDLLRVLPGSSYAAPQGTIRIDEHNHHTYLHPRIGRVNAAGQFDIVEQVERTVRPDPYLVSHSLQDWSARSRLTDQA